MSGKDKYSTLAAKLRQATAMLEEVENEIRGMEAMWGGPPSMINLAQYEHDPVTWRNLVRARSRYAYLMEERAWMRELVAAIRRKLEEVAR
jgi:exonuclease III